MVNKSSMENLNQREKIDTFVSPILKLVLHYPPASEVSREVANLTGRKNPHTPIYGVKEFVCLSVCLSVSLLQTLTPIIMGLTEQNGLKCF